MSRTHAKILFAAAAVTIVAFAIPVLAQHINGAGVATAGTRPAEVIIVGKPVETRRPNGRDQSPAFPGQTRAPGVITKTPLDIKVVASGLHKPWALAFLPDGDILITEKPGAMRIITQQGKIGKPIKNVPEVVFIQDGGLMDMVLDPNFAANRMIYFAYVEPRPGGDGRLNGTVIAKARLSDDSAALENFAKILVIKPDSATTAHYGARLLFAKDGTLFVSNGERYDHPTRDQAQDLNSQMGKIMHINTDGSAVKGNPFESTPGALPEIYTLGHRNPQGLAWNPVSGELWSTEHGCQGGDEINIIKPGKNYGWPIVAYGTEYSGDPIGDGITAKDGTEQPAYYWDPAVAPSGCCFYTAEQIPEWKNNFFVCSLVGQHLIRLELDGNKVVGEERLLLDQHQRMRDIEQGPDGALWVVTDSMDGRLIRIAAK